MNIRTITNITEQAFDQLAASLDASGLEFDPDANRLLATLYGLMGVMAHGTPEEYKAICNLVDKAMFRQLLAK